MNKKLNVWGREFDLKVIYDVYEDEEITSIQNEAYEDFIAKSGELLHSDEEVKKYCISIDSKNVGDNIDNIFKFVMPTSIYIKRASQNHIVALLCNYRFDEEHGIALVYVDGKFSKICTQDDI